MSPYLYPLDCLKSVSLEIKALRDHLCEVRSKLVEVRSLQNDSGYTSMITTGTTCVSPSDRIDCSKD